MLNDIVLAAFFSFGKQLLLSLTANLRVSTTAAPHPILNQVAISIPSSTKRHLKARGLDRITDEYLELGVREISLRNCA
jgi:hypothetical protein